MTERGYRIGNVDVTLILQKPKVICAVDDTFYVSADVSSVYVSQLFVCNVRVSLLCVCNVCVCR